MDITGVKVLDNIIIDYMKDLEINDKYKKCMNELINRKKIISYDRDNDIIRIYIDLRKGTFGELNKYTYIYSIYSNNLYYYKPKNISRNPLKFKWLM